MYKKLAFAALILSLSVSAAACSSDSKKTAESASPTQSAAATASPTATPAEDAGLYQAKAYIAGRLAEEKINQLFAQETTEDGKPILNSNIAKTKEEATAFLNAYLDPSLTEKVLTHYWTEDKAGEAILVKAEPFVAESASILKTASQDDVTFAGSADEVKMTLKDGGVYTAKKTAEGGYVISDIVK